MPFRYLFAAVLAAGALSAARAQPVTYTLTGTFSGSLGALSFNDAPGTFQFVGDTSTTNSLGAGFYTNNTGLSTFTFGGLTAIFLDPGFGVESQFNGAGFLNVNDGFGVGIYDPALGAYALTAPFSDTGYLETSFAAGLGTAELTSLGDLSLTGDNGTNATFTANQAAAISPEPGSFALLATGMLGIAGALRRRLA